MLTYSITATKPANFAICENENINLPTEVNNQILNSLNPVNHTISFYISLQDAQNNINAIQTPNQFSPPINVASFNLWVRLSENATSQCFDITDVTITIKPLPIVQNLEHVFACASFTLQPLTNGNYFTGANGTGTILNAGDVITTTTELYIYAEDNGCSAESQFTINIVQEFTMEIAYCEEFRIPDVGYGEFYSAPNGPNWTGQLLTPGTVFSNNTTIYYYSIFETVQCTDLQFDIIVHPLPPVDVLNNVTTCLSYTLPTLTNGNFFTGKNGTGTALNAGDVITNSQKIYIYNTDINTCTNQS